MSKWADYGISAVRYDVENKYIARVKVHVDNGDSIGIGSDWSRQDVLDKMDDNYTFITIKKGSDDKWQKGQDVHTITVKGVRYLRTDANSRESDNLENLPLF